MAAEQYAAAHQGKYPTDIKQLIEDPVPYLIHDICHSPKDGFVYTCSMSEKGYSFTGSPEIAGKTGSATYAITNDGIHSQNFPEVKQVD